MRWNPPVVAQPSSRQAEARRVLGVDAHADEQTIKRAFRRLARRYHPDMHPDAPGSAQGALSEKFATLAEAYRLLSRGV